MNYRGYDFEEKALMVGWQITITKDGTFVRNGSIFREVSETVVEAKTFIDSLYCHPRNQPQEPMGLAQEA